MHEVTTQTKIGPLSLLNHLEVKVEGEYVQLSVCVVDALHFLVVSD